MQYTLRRIPKVIDRAVRVRARREGRSINAVVLEVLTEGLIKRRDLSDLAGAWVQDEAVDAALEDQRSINRK